MTRQSSTLLLAAVAVVVLGAGIYFGTGEREQPARTVPQPAFPGLADQLGAAAAVEIDQGGKVAHLVRKGDDWLLPDRGDYPAQASRVHQLLASLAELKLDEPRTSDASEYGRLGLEDPPKLPPKDDKDSDKHGTLVRVSDAGGKVLAQVVVGHAHMGSGGTGEAVYIRLPGQAQTWLADGELTAEGDPSDWLNRDLLDISADKVVGVKVTRGAETLEFAREGGTLVLKSPANPPKLEQYKLDDIGRALEELTFETVQKQPAPGTPEGTAVFTTKAGMTITATITKPAAKPGEKAAGDIWATFDVTSTDKAKDAAAKLEAKVKGWAYQLAGWKEAAFVPTLDELKATLPSPPPKPAAPPAAPPAK